MWLVCTSAVRSNLPFRLAGVRYILGRTKSADIVVADSTVSRRHAEFECLREIVTLRDLGSFNGTFVNQKRISECRLQMGDRVRFGSVRCVVLPSPLVCSTGTDSDSTQQNASRSNYGVPIEEFTSAQQKILPFMLAGHSETEIATLLGKSKHTIHTHVRTMFERLGVHSREEMIVKLLKTK